MPAGRSLSFTHLSVLCREKTERRRRVSATPLEIQSALEGPSRGSVYAEGVSQVHHKSRGARATGNRKIMDHLLRSNRKYKGSGLSAHQFVAAVFLPFETRRVSGFTVSAVLAGRRRQPGLNWAPLDVNQSERTMYIACCRRKQGEHARIPRAVFSSCGASHAKRKNKLHINSSASCINYMLYRNCCYPVCINYMLCKAGPVFHIMPYCIVNQWIGNTRSSIASFNFHA